MPTDEQYIQEAREQYADTDHEFDSDPSKPPKVSRSEFGAWVQGWYWIDDDTLEDTDA
jgi:hypothetical protein